LAENEKERMTPNSEIDSAILSVCEPSWKKFAMILARAHDKLSGLPEGHEGYRLIAKRIQRLVQDGQLVAQGDISRPRYSEVRLPN
jgi:hypothetical protein